MGLPLISTFVESSIDQAMREYCAPRSLSMDVAEILLGDGLSKTTDAFGVLVVNIKSARGLAKSDARGSSDPYVVIQFSRLARPLFSTRIIIDDLSPHFEETAVILVTGALMQSC
jgi:Ca2+-dependent lipid-binding protein